MLTVSKHSAGVGPLPRPTYDSSCLRYLRQHRPHSSRTQGVKTWLGRAGR